jgi:hypothetical protein
MYKLIMSKHFTYIIFLDGPNFFALLHVTTWIWIEMERQLIIIIEN